MGDNEGPTPPPREVAAYLRNMSPRVIRVRGTGPDLLLPPLYEVRPGHKVACFLR